MLNSLSKIDAAYIAGIVDGEGCIGIYRTGGHKRKDAARLSLRLTVGSTYKPLLNWLRSTTGIGGVCVHSSGGERNKPSWEWQARGRQAVELLFQLVPYVVIKEKQIHIACEFANSMGMGGRHELTPRTVVMREKMAQAIHKLNRRGGINAVR